MSKVLVAIVAMVVVFLLVRNIGGGQAAKDNLQAGAAFMAANKDNEGVITTASGLQYERLVEGTGTVHPQASSVVKVHYHGTLIDGTVFDSSVERGEPIEFGLQQVIKGWTEGLQMMVVGEKARLMIPAELAYGNRSAGKIGPGSTLVFEVDLLEIN